MNNKLYVGNLSFTTSNDSLKDCFTEAGEVTSANIIMDRATNRSKGFGFVEMSNEESATKAIELFDGKELDGRNIKVNIARPREEKPNKSW